MRVAAVLLAVTWPVAAFGQAMPAANPPRAQPAPAKPASPAKPPPQKPPPQKPPPPRPGSKPAPGRPAGKPAGAKPGPAKPPPPKPAPPAPPPPKPEPTQGSKTGLPLPRFAALRFDDVNFRRGPGDRYPVEWVYKRRDLPVQIEREFDAWRLVMDPDGTKGWVNAATLTGRRTAVVAGSERVLRGTAAETGAAVAKLQAGVIVRLRSCEANSDWCQVSVGDYRGFLKRAEIWGTLPGEVIQ